MDDQTPEQGPVDDAKSVSVDAKRRKGWRKATLRERVAFLEAMWRASQTSSQLAVAALSAISVSDSLSAQKSRPELGLRALVWARASLRKARPVAAGFLGGLLAALLVRGGS